MGRWLISEHSKPTWDNPEWSEWIEELYELNGRPTLETLVARF